jgi:leucyl aminopeptidase (aminopeptidase T)
MPTQSYFKAENSAVDPLPSKELLSDAYRSVAEKVLTESLRLKAGEALTIETWSTGLPFANEAALEAKKLGAFPLMLYEDEKGYVRGVKSTPKDALGKMGRHEYGLLSSSDAYVFIPGPPISGYYPKITRKEFMESTAYNGSWYRAAKKSKLRGARLTFGWVGTDLARLLGKDRDEIVLHQLRAAMVNYGKLGAKAKQVEKLLGDGAEATLLTQDAQLRVRLKGDVEIQDGITDGEDVAQGSNLSYVPPGYVGKDIEVASVEGSVHVSPSITRYGMLEDAELRFSKGKFAGWTSRGSTEVLQELERVIPPKARMPTYLLIGLNPSMKFGYAQDRFPEGAITVAGGFGAIVRKGTLTVGGRTIVENGKLD